MNIFLRNSISQVRILSVSKRTCDFLLKYFCSNSARINLREIMDIWKIRFENSNIPEANVSTQLIASRILQVADIDKLDHFRECELNDHQIAEFNRCCECRLARIPLQYILEEWDFRDTKLKMIPPVFIPRPETEMLIDIIADCTNNVQKGLEIGCGSGAISIALLKKFSELRMDAVDQSKAACNLTLANGELNHVENRLNVFRGKIEEDGSISNYEIESSVDFVVSNPPYLFTAELFQLEPEVKLYEDLRALDGGRDGLRIIKAIFLFSSKTLAPCKSCFIEIHHHHNSMIRKWLEENSHLNLRYNQCFKDFFGQDRFIHVVKQ